MFRVATAVILTAAIGGCAPSPQPVAAASAAPHERSATRGARWVVIKASGLDCPTCVAQLREELEATPGLSQVEVFAPQPYCRFYVNDDTLDVAEVLSSLPDYQSTLAGLRFIRGG
jgi:copper chaperone CopZ